MFCRNCGAEVKDDWKICPNCGKVIVRNNVKHEQLNQQEKKKENYCWSNNRCYSCWMCWYCVWS